MCVSRLDDVASDLEIDGDEISWVFVFGMNPTDFGCGEDDVERFLCGEEGFNVGLVSEIKL